MIKHIVMWTVRGDDAAARAHNLELLKAEFESLRGRIPGLLELEVGVDESRIDYACDVVLYTVFASRQALLDYAEHPEHLRVRRNLGDMRSARHQVDYEVQEAVATERCHSPLPAGTRASQPQSGDTHHVQAVR